MSNRVRVLTVLTSALLATSAALSETPLVLHWDTTRQVSIAVVNDANGTPLAIADWNAPLPLAYLAAGPQQEIPVPVLAVLRDQLDANPAPGAASGAAFIRSLMGPYATTPTSQISSAQTVWLSYSRLRIVESCGSWFDATGCGGTCNGTSGSLACTGCACKRTTILPL